MKEEEVEVTADRRRQREFQRMLPALQTVTMAVHDKLRILQRGRNLIFYDIGRLLSTMCEKPDIYGDHLDNLAKYLGVDVMFLCGIRNVAAVFDRDFIEIESITPMACGAFLQIAYFVELCKLDSEEEQTALLRRIREENLSCSEVGKLVAMVPRRAKRPSK